MAQLSPAARAPILEELAGRYPNTVAAFSSMPGGEGALRAVVELQRRWVALHTTPPSNPLVEVERGRDLPACSTGDSYDVVIAGGGLGLVAGAVLAARGLRVMVFDRDRVGAAHREWNISERELASLTRWGLFSTDELRGTVAARYSRGLISFDSEGAGLPACPLDLEGVLDVALDAQRVLDLARERFLDAGGTIKEGRRFERLHVARTGPVASVFELDGEGGPEFYRARLAVDTMGSISTIALGLNGGVPFDGVCPTVGTVVEGLCTDQSVGDVLVSVAPAQDGRQLIWEGFPGRGGETTVYVFYYGRTGAREAPEQSLLDLYERYFTLLPTYRAQGSEFRHLKPVFGYIPARHGRTGRTAARGLLCLGDSAAGQSPLTFCGFGSFVRHIGRVAMLLQYALRHDLLEDRHLKVISPHQPNLRVSWVFSRFMQTWPGSDPAAVNRIMNVFCRVLGELGPRTTVRFLQDRYTFREYIRIMLKTARFYPQVSGLTARLLGPRGLLKWVGDMAAFAADDVMKAVFRTVGRGRWRRIEQALERMAPAAALRAKALRTRWEATS